MDDRSRHVHVDDQQRHAEGVDAGRGEIGATVAEKNMDVHDSHATILHLLKLDHEQLT